MDIEHPNNNVVIMYLVKKMQQQQKMEKNGFPFGDITLEN